MISKTINRTIYALWLGDEVMNDDRKNSINNLGVNRILITKHNIHEYVLDNHPLHPAYQYLSTVHKSDYLRSYLMYHYGGGYSDVKYTNINWEEGFDKIDKNDNIMMVGIKTSFGHTYAGIEEWSEDTKNNIILNIGKLCVMGWFICRPKSPIVIEWYNELNRRLDIYLPKLIINPSKFTRECFIPSLGHAYDGPSWELKTKKIRTDYPLSWNILLSQILYPLQVKYINNIDNTMSGHRV